jgi:hypothetical protein
MTLIARLAEGDEGHARPVLSIQKRNLRIKVMHGILVQKP